ncbi:phosphotransferase [Cohnella fermenti]|uniref:Aminoglycoside phosphotransferase n=1 Tax=Cohnella fermenti TaxID=2565925 RepID=A0A4S4BWC5_9BACL|nr:phosphotransferase [Cohnella fermenti]THF79475.1 aminoglycoside phosphotransferase [Cohnella fermenti]
MLNGTSMDTIIGTIMQRYAADASYALTEGASGYNNTTRYIECGGERYVMRIYETHRDSAKIRFEHSVLTLLGNKELPFGVPQPAALSDGSGSFLELEDGRYACLFRYMDGVRPNSRLPAAAAAVGETIGRLSRALAAAAPEEAPEYPPYYEMDLAHPSCGPEVVAGFCLAPPAEFADQAAALRTILGELERFRASLPRLRELPHQLVHGDVNDSNLLAAPDDPARIVAVLDFEFATRDLRAMEPAVVLSGMLGDEAAERTIPAFLAGFARHVRLSEEEADAVPSLIKLRKLDVFVHFLGRYLDGVDGAAVLREQIGDAAAGLIGLERTGERLAEWCRLLTE